ncbi:MAG: DUF4392 domain-containing protein [Armatimonadetes bacterium]|nr:DUF4392 domain-containing protein [Armatimonadota bacterium]
MDETLRNIGENLDRLCTVTVRPQGTGQAVIRHLYDAAREKLRDPLTMLAAQRLLGVLRPGEAVMIATGAGIEDFLPAGETDGPLGAAAMAWALANGAGAIPVFVTEAEYVENVAATALAAGLGRRDFDAARRVPGTCVVLPFPADDTAEPVARQYVDRYQPQAIIAIEKLGPNAVGVAHTATGLPTGKSRARAEAIFDLAASCDILTVGIGDNGNEIGCGTVIDAVRKYKEHGAVCRCPCGQGIATRVATDVLVLAGTSNWGGYGVAAALAASLGRPELLHSADVERFMLQECVRTGAADGSSGRHTLSVDGTPGIVQTSMLEMMRAVITIGLQPPRKRPF